MRQAPLRRANRNSPRGRRLRSLTVRRSERLSWPVGRRAHGCAGHRPAANLAPVHDYIRRYVRTGVKPLHRRDTVREAAHRLSVEQLTDLPVVGDDGRIIGLFGEKELIESLSPGYLGELRHTTFIARDFEDVADEARKVMNEP